MQVHLSTQQPDEGRRSSAASRAPQPAALEEQRHYSLGTSAQEAARTQDTAQSAVQISKEDSQPHSPAVQESSGFAMSDIAALYERKAEDGMSLAADLAAAISAVDLTDVLTDDNPFATAKVRSVGPQ